MSGVCLGFCPGTVGRQYGVCLGFVWVDGRGGVGPFAGFEVFARIMFSCVFMVVLSLFVGVSDQVGT